MRQPFAGEEVEKRNSASRNWAREAKESCVALGREVGSGPI